MPTLRDPMKKEAPVSNEPWWHGLPPDATAEDYEQRRLERMSPEVRREWEALERDPQGYRERMYREHFEKLERQQRLQQMMQPPPPEVDL